jgi:hypothetical protein
MGFNVIRKGLFKLSAYALWLGQIGTAYVVDFASTPNKKLTLKETMVNLFGEADYKKLSLEKQAKIEAANVGVTIEFPKSMMTPRNPLYDPNIKEPADPRSQQYLPSVSSDDIRRSSFDSFINALARGIHNLNKSGKGSLTDTVFKMAAGVAVGIVLCLIFRWGAPVEVVSSK